MNRQQRRASERAARRSRPDTTWRAGLARPTEKVVAGYLSPGQVEAEFHESLINTYQLDQTRGVRRFTGEWRIHGRAGANISRARNRICREFLALEHRPEWLWLVDTDMRWEPDAVEALLAVAQPDRILGGLCFAYGPGGRVIPTIFFRDELGRLCPVEDGYRIPERTLLQVHGTGGAFLLVHRDALLAIHEQMPLTPNPWFREIEPLIDNPDHDPDDDSSLKVIPHWISEDLFFCDMAARAGLSVFVHTGVEIGHKKPHWLTQRLYDSDTSAMEWA